MRLRKDEINPIVLLLLRLIWEGRKVKERGKKAIKRREKKKRKHGVTGGGGGYHVHDACRCGAHWHVPPTGYAVIKRIKIIFLKKKKKEGRKWMSLRWSPPQRISH